MSELPSTGSRRPSLRVLLALGGAAAMVTGAVAATDTKAASTDAATAQVSQIASENFFPTPLPSANPTCSQSGVTGFRKPTISWPSAGPGYAYRLTLWNNALTSVVRQPWYQSGTSYQFSFTVANPNVGHYTLTVQTVNLASGASDATRLYSSGWLTHNVYTNGANDGTCQGGSGRKANATWEDAAAWTPSSPQVLGRSVKGRVLPEAVDSTSAPSTTESAEPSESTTPSTPTAPASTPPAETAPETSETGEVPSPTTEQPAEDSTVTFGIGVAGDKRVLLIYRDGEEVCHTPLDPDDQPSINGGTVVIQNGGTVKSVDTTTCEVS